MSELQKVDLKKAFPSYEGDFVPLGEEYSVLGWSMANTKKGPVETLALARVKDGLKFTVFADQLRQDAKGALLVSKAQLEKQIARAAEFAKGAPGAK